MAYERTLIQIRERSFLDLLDLALVVARGRPWPIALAAAAGALPCALFNAWLATDQEFPLAVYFFLLPIESAWATAPLTVVLGGLMFGERSSAWSVARLLLRRLPALIFYQGFIRTILILTLILFPIIPARLAFTNEVILLERGKFLSVVKRSANLVGDRGGDFFGQWLAQLLFGMLFVFCFSVGTDAMFSALTTSELTWEDPVQAGFLGFRTQLAVWIAISFFGVARFLTYIDQRIRLEGWEVKLRIQAVGASLREGRS